MPTMPMTLLANIPFLLTILEVLIKILTMISMRLVKKRKKKKMKDKDHKPYLCTGTLDQFFLYVTLMSNV